MATGIWKWILYYRNVLHQDFLYCLWSKIAGEINKMLEEYVILFFNSSAFYLYSCNFCDWIGKKIMSLETSDKIDAQTYKVSHQYQTQCLLITSLLKRVAQLWKWTLGMCTPLAVTPTLRLVVYLGHLCVVWCKQWVDVSHALVLLWPRPWTDDAAVVWWAIGKMCLCFWRFQCIYNFWTNLNSP